MSRYDVYIDGQGYILDAEYGDKAYSETPQEGYIGKDKDQSNFWQNWTMRSFHGGERQATMLAAKDELNFQYHRAEGLVLSEFGEVTLQPALVLSKTISSTTTPMVATMDGSRVVVGLSVAPWLVFWFNDTSWQDAATVPYESAVTDIICAGATLYAIQGGHLITSTDSGITWTEATYTLKQVKSIDVTSQGSGYTTATVTVEGGDGSGCTAHANITDGAVTSIDLDTQGNNYTTWPTVRITGDGTGAAAISTLETGTATSFTDAVGVAVSANDVFVLSPTLGLINVTDSERVAYPAGGVAICNYREEVYWLQDRRLWVWNGKAAFVYDELPNSFYGTALFPYRQILFIIGYFKAGSGYRAAVYAIVSGNESHLCSWGDYSADHRIYAMAGGDDEVYVASPDRGGMDRYDITYGGLTCGPAWGAFGSIPFKGAAYALGKLFVGRYDGVPATDGIYIANVENPTTFRSEGYLETSEFDYEFANDEKILGSIGVYHRPLLEGESLKVEYSFDGGTTYILAGVSNNVGATRRVFRFSNLRFDTCKVKVTLYGPGTSTPTLKKILVRACAVSEAKWRWGIHVIADKVASRTGRVRKGYVSISKLKDTSDRQLPVAFIDRIGGTHTAIVEACEIDQAATSKRRAFLYIIMREL